MIAVIDMEGHSRAVDKNTPDATMNISIMKSHKDPTPVWRFIGSANGVRNRHCCSQSWSFCTCKEPVSRSKLVFDFAFNVALDDRLFFVIMISHTRMRPAASGMYYISDLFINNINICL